LHQLPQNDPIMEAVTAVATNKRYVVQCGSVNCVLHVTMGRWML
jgi:hypothetical protein